MVKEKPKRRLRMYDVLDVIVQHADEHGGVTPSSRTIAAILDLSQSRVHYLMTRLENKGFIRYLETEKDKYEVVDAEFDAPPHVLKAIMVN